MSVGSTRSTTTTFYPAPREGLSGKIVTDERLQHFLLYELDDDWMPLGSFVAIVRRVAADDSSMVRVADVIEDFAQRGLMTIGSWSTVSGTWERWTVPIAEAMTRIADGHDGEVGYRAATEKELGSTEVFRGEITDKGRKLLAALGSPYDKYGDPWEGDEHLAAEGHFRPWEK